MERAGTFGTSGAAVEARTKHSTRAAIWSGRMVALARRGLVNAVVRGDCQINRRRTTVSLIETARDALKSIPMSDILRERLSLTIDQLAISEAKIEILQRENGKLASRLDQEQVQNSRHTPSFLWFSWGGG
jgi:hypothetical protein